MTVQTTQPADARPAPGGTGLKPYIVLTKPMLNFLVVLTSAAGFALGSHPPLDWPRLLLTTLGTLLAALAAATLNQYLERHQDARMERTRNRPLPRGLVSPPAALALGLALAVAGVGLLYITVNWLSALLAALTLVIYLAIYTPLKKHNHLCTLVGAVTGAIPPLIGYAGAAGRLDYAAWTLAALLFVWQIPHFLALAWRYREDYTRGGFQMLSAVDAEGRLNSHMLFIYSIALLPISLTPVLAGLTGEVYFFWALVLGHGLMMLAGYQHRTRTVRSARLVFLASVIYLPVVLGVMVWDNHHSLLHPVMAAEPPPAFSAGEHCELNGFDLDGLTVPAATVVAATGRDSIPALTAPDHVPAATAIEGLSSGGHGHGKFIVPGERVIGFELNGEARAYPLRILNWHEVVNDELGGVPVCVTYSPLSDSVVVFDRRIDGAVLEFGVSGLLYNSNLLLYDRAADGSPSLWSQLTGRAVSGPAAAAGRGFTPLPCALTYWEDWHFRHPETTVLTGDTNVSKRYKSDPYGHYFLTGEPRFPTEPLPDDTGLPLMSRVAAVRGDDGWHVYAYQATEFTDPAELPKTTDAATGAELTRLPRSYGMQPHVVQVELPEGAETPVVYALWFAWHAAHPETVVDRGLLSPGR